MREGSANRKWWTLAAMCFALFMIMLDNTVVNVALPSIQRSLDASPANLEWTVNSYVLTFAVLMMLGGTLGDRYGRRRMFIAGLFIFSASSAACALAQSDGVLIAARISQGVGAALLSPLSLSIIVAAFPRRQLPVAIGTWAGISGLGLAAGPLIGGFLVEQAGWSSVFWINVPIGLIAVLVAGFAVDESRDPTSRKFDITGTALVTAGLFLLVWGLIKTGSHGWGSSYTLAFLGSSVALIVVFVFWESRASDPMLPLSFFRSRPFTVSTIVITFAGFALMGSIFFITLYFQNVKGYSAFEAGLRTIPVTAMVVIFGPIAGRLNARFGPRPLASLGMLLAAGGLFHMTNLDVDTPYMSGIMPFYTMVGLGLALTMPTVASTGMSSVDANKSGIAAAAVNASRQIGSAIGIAVLGAVAASITKGDWASKVAGIPALSDGGGAKLTQLVLGGEGQAIGRIAGRAASEAALQSFTAGVRGTMLVTSALMLAAAVTAFIGFKGAQLTEPAKVATAPVEP